MRADRNTIEQAYAFFHQKLKVYEHSTFRADLTRAVNAMEAAKDLRIITTP